MAAKGEQGVQGGSGRSVLFFFWPASTTCQTTRPGGIASRQPQIAVQSSHITRRTQIVQEIFPHFPFSPFPDACRVRCDPIRINYRYTFAAATLEFPLGVVAVQNYDELRVESVECGA